MTISIKHLDLFPPTRVRRKAKTYVIYLLFLLKWQAVLDRNELLSIHSSILLASPSCPQPSVPSSLPLSHPWLSRHCGPGEPPDTAQRLHHLPADASVACSCCYGHSALGPAEGPHPTRPAPSFVLLHSPTW